MEQKITAPNDADLAHIEKQRGWARDHYEPDAQHKYGTVEGKLRLLDTVIRSKWIEPSETWKLQSLGIALGDALVQALGLSWVMVEDEQGRDPALRDDGTTTIVFPLTMISKRIERGEDVDVRELFALICKRVSEMRSGATKH